MTMQGEIAEKINGILDTELSEVGDQVDEAVSLMEGKMYEIEEIIRTAVGDLDDLENIYEVKEALTKLAEEI